MTPALHSLSTMLRSEGPWFDAPSFLWRISSIRPKLLYGVRVWVAVCLALYIAYWLQLDNAYWAGTTAAIVAQPSLGASLRKGRYRLIGTLLGAVAAVILTACFPQNRVCFLLGLALWSAVCGGVAITLRNFAAYGAGLAGFTCVIIAGDELGATGGAHGDVFLLALTRVTEIGIGVVSAALVMAGSDLGRARRHLADLCAALAAEVLAGLGNALTGASSDEMRTNRRDLIRRVIALGQVIDEAIGEAPDLGFRSQALHATVEGLFIGLSSWRVVATHLEFIPAEQGRQDAEAILRYLPLELRPAAVQRGASSWTADAVHLRRTCVSAARMLIALRVETSSLRMLADGTAEALIGISRALDGVALLSNRDWTPRRIRATRPPIPDFLPVLINAARIFVTISLVELFWIATAWPSGALAVTWSAIFVITFSPSMDKAYADARSRCFGVAAAAGLAAIIKFAVLPGNEAFSNLAIVIGIVLVPAAALSTLSWQAPVFGAIAAWFLPLLNPENQTTYDTLQFYNSALAIVAGAGVATLAFCLLPLPSPAARTARLLALTLRDLRHLTVTPDSQTRSAWESVVYSRLSIFPEEAGPLQRARLLIALSVGSEIIRLRQMARRLGRGRQIDVALEPLARGDSTLARRGLEDFDNVLAINPAITARRGQTLRARGSIRVISEGLLRHRAFFDSQATHDLS